MHESPTAGRLGDSREDFKQGSLASSIAANNAQNFAFFYFKRDVFYCPNDFGFRGLLSARSDPTAQTRHNLIAQSIVALMGRLNAIPFGKPFDLNCNLAHQITSAKPRSIRLK